MFHIGNFLQIHQKSDVIVLEQVLEGTISEKHSQCRIKCFYNYLPKITYRSRLQRF